MKVIVVLWLQFRNTVSFPPPFVTGEQSEQWLLQSASELWAPWLDKQAQETLLKYELY